MKYPALDVRGVDTELALALVDDCAPTAVEDLADGVSIFFTNAARRDEACAVLQQAWPRAVLAPRDVDDEDWARRSQQNLGPITVGRITVSPPWFVEAAPSERPDAAGHGPLTIAIVPSMGFGTGHHATTRLCLAALQRLDLRGRTVLDVGTGSGVLAIAASLLGAVEAIGIDVDPDAIASARENLDLNPGALTTRFDLADLRDTPLPAADVVVANLTGAVLVQSAAVLSGAVRRQGTLIVSGLQAHERADVLAAFEGRSMVWSAEEEDWVALALTAPPERGV